MEQDSQLSPKQIIGWLIGLSGAMATLLVAIASILWTTGNRITALEVKDKEDVRRMEVFEAKLDKVFDKLEEIRSEIRNK